MKLEDFKRSLLADPEVAAAYDALQPTYDVARQIIALRAARQISQAELAARVGTKQSSISRLENANNEPSIATLEKICRALDARLVIQLVPNS